ncbi:hypothetical protein FRC03_012588 [Tulasnella sp. 419]|nr:hypothetical protein FRC03_012588 [Tulasnella sp. 419]
MSVASATSGLSQQSVSPEDSVSQVGGTSKKRTLTSDDEGDVDGDHWRPTKKPTSWASSSSLDKSLDLKSVGRILARTTNPFMDIDSVIRAGLARNPSLPASAFTKNEQCLHKYYDIICQRVPCFQDQLLAGGGEGALNGAITTSLAKGRCDALSTDVNTLKNAIPQWCETDPPLPKDDKSRRGFKSDVTGALLCPHTEEWALNTTKSKLRSGELVVTHDQWPNFIFADHACPDIEDLPNKVFRGEILVKAFQRVFIGTATSGGDKQNNRSLAYKSGLKSVTPASIGYVATLLRSALSSDAILSSGRDDTLPFSYATFFDGIVDYFNEEDDEIIADLLSWWNHRIFPGLSGALKNTGKPSSRELLAKQRKERRSKAAGSG